MTFDASAILAGVAIIVIGAAIIGLVKMQSSFTRIELTATTVANALQDNKREFVVTMAEIKNNVTDISQRLYQHKEQHIRVSDLDELRKTMEDLRRGQAENVIRLEQAITSREKIGGKKK